MRKNKLAVSLAVASAVVAVQGVNAASVELHKYNLVVTGYMESKSHIHGMSVVNNLYAKQLTEFGVRPTEYDGNSLMIAGTAKGEVRIFEGNLEHDSTFSSPNFTVHTNNSSTYNANATSMIASSTLTQLANQMTLQSAAFSSMGSVGGQATVAGDQVNKILRFEAAAGYSAQVVINVTLADLQNATQFAFNLGSASSVVINVVGSGELNNSNFTSNPGGVAQVRSNVIWNFVDEVTVKTSAWWGTILGPQTTLYHTNDIDGSVYVQNLYQSGQIHNFQFIGELPPPPSPGPLPVPLPLAATSGMALMGLSMLGRRR